MTFTPLSSSPSNPQQLNLQVIRTPRPPDPPIHHHPILIHIIHPALRPELQPIHPRPKPLPPISLPTPKNLPKIPPHTIVRALRERIHDESLVLDVAVGVLQAHGDVEGDVVGVGEVSPVDGRGEAKRGVGEGVEVEEERAGGGVGGGGVEGDDGRGGAEVGWACWVLFVEGVYIGEVEEVTG